MPIINEYNNESVYYDGFPQAGYNCGGYAGNRVPAIMNVNGDAVRGYSLRLTNIKELANQDTINEAIAFGEALGLNEFNGWGNRPLWNQRP